MMRNLLSFVRNAVAYRRSTWSARRRLSSLPEASTHPVFWRKDEEEPTKGCEACDWTGWDDKGDLLGTVAAAVRGTGERWAVVGLECQVCGGRGIPSIMSAE